MTRSRKHLALPLVALLAACAGGGAATRSDAAGPSVRPERSAAESKGAGTTSKSNSNATSAAKPSVRPEPG
ncbi:MAG: hypothetical protein ACJ79R_06900, partial [Anaeromyxobacteraceae bacterium]